MPPASLAVARLLVEVRRDFVGLANRPGGVTDEERRRFLETANGKLAGSGWQVVWCPIKQALRLEVDRNGPG